MYEIQFVASSSSGWAQAISVIDATTDSPLDLADTTFELEVQSPSGGRMLFATTADMSIQRPRADVIQWRFPPEETRRMRRDTTYSVGCRAVSPGGVTQLFIGTLALIDGEIR